MDTNPLAGLEPAAVFDYFRQLCAIPHGSGNTGPISDYLVAFAQQHGLRHIRDEINNVIIFADGTCGYETHAPVILQGHMDMVCQKDEDCPIDMQTQGLDVTHDGRYVFARGTTLGGDDGIALAYALALLADPTIAHPPLEVVLTVDEETGMDGAAGIDLSMLRGRTMLNIDSEDEGVFTVSCAGGAKASICVPVQRRAVYGPCVRLSVEGLQGGHSGVEIDKNRANAVKVMGLLLERIQALMPICVTSLQGGGKDNAIPQTCSVTLVALGMYIERINGIIAQLQDELRQQYDEPGLVIRGDDVDALGGNALTSESTAKLIALLSAAPNGVQAWSADIDCLVQTSLNLGIAELTSEQLRLTFAVRSSVEQEKQELLGRLGELADFHGGTYTVTGQYPAWEYRKDSPLRSRMVELYTDLFGRPPQVVAIHAGLECGLLARKLPGLDCVSIGPQMHDIHTTREKLDIPSTARTWQFLQALLQSL